MKAEIKKLFSLDVDDLTQYIPDDPERFGLSLRLIAGPYSEPGEESFDLVVCTPRWIAENLGEEGTLIGRHHLIVDHYDYVQLRKFVEKYVNQCTGNTWHEVAEKLGRLGKWEFEDYRPYVASPE